MWTASFIRKKGTVEHYLFAGLNFRAIGVKGLIRGINYSRTSVGSFQLTTANILHYISNNKTVICFDQKLSFQGRSQSNCCHYHPKHRKLDVPWLDVM